MKVLWFEVTQPSGYNNSGIITGGWQDSLESIVKSETSIELSVVFVTDRHLETRVVDGVKYFPIFCQYGSLERIFNPKWDLYVKKVLPQSLQIIKECEPDIIHIFGTEWPFGQIAKYVEVPVVIHIQGAIVPYNNALYPPGYSINDRIDTSKFNPLYRLRLLKEESDSKNWEAWERSTWNIVCNYMGRTDWDYALSQIMHPGCRYFHVEEALRTPFISGDNHWIMPQDNKIRLITTGLSTFWKGPDMLLKTAHILSESGIDFEWLVAGKISDELRMVVEQHEKLSFENNHVKILGFVNTDELCDILCHSSMMVHTAYIENSPNSICEAQCIGVPVISTNVGGISTLVRNGIDGILVPANDPWQMAYNIITLSKDIDRMKKMSEETMLHSKSRHNPQNIIKQLLNCYCELSSNKV